MMGWNYPYQNCVTNRQLSAGRACEKRELNTLSLLATEGSPELKEGLHYFAFEMFISGILRNPPRFCIKNNCVFSLSLAYTLPLHKKPRIDSRMHPQTRQLLLPFAAVSMISLLACTRALAFVSRGPSGVAIRLKGVGSTAIAARLLSSSISGKNGRTSSRLGTRMDVASPAVDVKTSNSSDGTANAGVVGKTPRNRLISAPPNFTPNPYE